MPAMQAMVEEANKQLNRDNIARISISTAPGQNLGDACQALGVATTQAQINFLNGWPVGLQNALLAAVDSARSRRVPVQLTWMEGPYKLTIFEAAGTDTSLGGMTINLQTPLPPS